MKNVIFAQNFFSFVYGEKKRGFQPIAKKGEAICNDKLVNIFTENKGCACSSY